jgi:hypothetical protein
VEAGPWSLLSRSYSLTCRKGVPIVLPRLSCMFCVCILVLTTHKGLVTSSVAAPADAAAAMWMAGVAGTRTPPGRFVNAFFRLS